MQALNNAWGLSTVNAIGPAVEDPSADGTTVVIFPPHPSLMFGVLS